MRISAVIVKETIKVISDFGHVLVDCFEFEGAPQGADPGFFLGGGHL